MGTDKGLPMRPLFVCLSWVVLFWGVCADTTCDTEVIPGHVVNVEESMKSGAHVEVLQVYRSANMSTCVEDCCEEKYGKCTLIGFNNAAKKAMNCYHFLCSPVDSCQFANSTGTDSSRIRSTSKETLAGNSTDFFSDPNSNGSASFQKSGEQETIRSISARKGAVLQVSSFSDADSTGSITARKGVSYPEEDQIEGDGTFSKARKGVSLESERILSFEKDDTSVKARKGVDDISSEDVNISENSTLVLQSFVEENATQNSEEVTHKLNSTRQDFEANITQEFKETPKIMPSSLAFRTGMVEAKSSQDFKISTISYKEDQSRTREQGSSVPTETSSKADQRSPKEGAFHHRFSSPIAHLVSSETFNFTSVTVKAKELDDGVEEFKMSSVFLVVALVMGLLLLFVVLGVVSKHVHDIWMRRHYHRMDFLIDGMYDSYA